MPEFDGGDDEQGEVERMKRDLADALDDEAEAASRVALLLQELEDMGVDTAGLDTRP